MPDAKNDLLFQQVQTQDSPPPGSCDYLLQMFDSFGDGWNGGTLTITINGSSTDYTLITGTFEAVVLTIPDSAQVQLEYVAGGFPTEVSYDLTNPNFETVFSDGPGPTEGLVFDQQLICPTCIVPSNVTIDEVGALFADISWQGSSSDGTYMIDYVVQGQPADSVKTLMVDGLSATLPDLIENTTYEFTILLDCGSELSPQVGPFEFTTIWLNDVGVAQILGPQTDCGIGTETISLLITNYGQSPQSLFNFRYSVNGVPASIPMFSDGFFTAVVGTTDSIEIDFETTYDFSVPGNYTIAVWTELEGDSDLANDTITIEISNIPVIAEFPHTNGFENGDGGWSVDENGENSSWEFGAPAGGIINQAANGTNAWVTSLGGDYNVNERSFIVSPCFDFSDLTVDPLIRFSIIIDTETNWDGCWLEGSKDGGASWEKIGAIGTGENWYNIDNTTIDLGDVWAGESGGWINAEHVLDGFAGEGSSLFRFAFGSDGSVTNEGVGIDDIFISPPLANDLAAELASVNTSVECGSFVENISIDIINDGIETQTGFQVFYQVDNETPVAENVGALSIASGETASFTFSQPFAFVEGTYDVRVWTNLDTDANNNNDTTFTEVIVTPIIVDYPYFIDFEDQTGGWKVDESSQNSSWQFGTPDNFLISDAASGVNAWVTNLVGSYNGNEFSYILSPCYDFSSETDDPLINFAINYNTETNWDGAWLEGSTDGGVSWEKIGAIGTGVNWYTIENTNIDLGDVWAGDSGGWINAEHVLDGFAGQGDCRFRFAFGSDGGGNFEGVGIDNIFISPPLANDMSTISVAHTGSDECGDMMDNVVMEIRNAGTLAQSGFDVFYQVGNNPPVMENVGALTVAPGEITNYIFTQSFDSEILNNTFDVRAWVALASEQNEVNDTSDFSFTTITPDVLPLIVDFENVALPTGWTSTGFVDNGHNAPSFVLTENLFEFNTDFSLESFPIGPINPGDSLTFDYRYVDFPDGLAATVLGNNVLEVQISDDCGNNFQTELTIDASNHIASTDMANRKIDLDAYAGNYISIRFISTWAEGDYFLDIDNINIIGCPETLAIGADITPESTAGAADGGIFADPAQGVGPFQFTWSNGEDTQVITGLTSDTYTVTVTDINGCIDVASFDIVVCPDDLNITSETINESSSGAGDGSISVDPQGGIAPYIYSWNNGATTASIDNLTAGTYTVTVTDANGCEEVLDFVLDFNVATTNMDALTSLKLQPNPTQQLSSLFLEFEGSVDVEVQLHNMLGQTLVRMRREGVQSAHFPLDLSNLSSGMYLVSVQVGSQRHVEKLILNR
ncbi:MAG: T9SS type A sorting domain-containing protein [Bacteroidota bacterium]